MASEKTKRVIYIDVEDTLIRSLGPGRSPMIGTVEYVRAMHDEGAELYCWSEDGADFARSVAEELEIADCFRAFLPKPQVIVDDRNISDWRGLFVLHPLSLPATRPSVPEDHD
ncbi:MAG: hypothetical protein SFU56_19865 [Capsulimonadales bacterium]|nr:hypothetical protein [Capsulimonadales bacterium]